MNGSDVQLLIRAYRREPRQVTTVAVALAMLAYRRQVGLDLRASELATQLGISDSLARRAVRRARILCEPETEPGGRNLTVPDCQTSRNLTVPAEPHGTGTLRYREAEPYGTENGTLRYRAIEKEREESSAAAGRNLTVPDCQTGESEPEPFALPDPQPLKGPPGRGSREADELAEWCELMNLGNGGDGAAYAAMARDLCDHTQADWVRLFLECQVVLWARRPTYRLAAKVLRDWRGLGEPEPRYLAAVAPSKPLPPTGTAGGSPPAPPRNSRRPDFRSMPSADEAP